MPKVVPFSQSAISSSSKCYFQLPVPSVTLTRNLHFVMQQQ